MPGPRCAATFASPCSSQRWPAVGAGRAGTGRVMGRDCPEGHREVVYLQHAGNAVASTSGTIPPFHDRVRGGLPW